MRLLRRRGAGLILHLGDVGTLAVLEELLGGPPGEVRVVFGNCDDAWELGRDAERLGLVVDHPVGRLEVAGRRVIYSHGHLPLLLDEALRDGVDLIFHGHTHELRNELIGRTRIVNPGALHRAARRTVALVEPQEGRVEVLEVE